MRFYRTQTDNNGNCGTCSLKRIENTNNRWIDITLFSLFSVDPGDALVFGVGQCIPDEGKYANIFIKGIG